MPSTVTGLSVPIRVPTNGDVFDVPGDMLKTVTDMVAAVRAIPRIEARKVDVNVNTLGYGALVFAQPFTAPPVVVAWAMNNTQGMVLLNYDPATVSASGVAFFVRGPGGGTPVDWGWIGIMYIAIGPG